MNTHLPNAFTKGEIWAMMKDATNLKTRDIHGLKLEFLKCLQMIYVSQSQSHLVLWPQKVFQLHGLLTLFE